jgi:hypothetical protein
VHVAEEVMEGVAFPVSRLPERLEELLRAGVDTSLESGHWQPLRPDLEKELRRAAAA